MLLVEGHLQEEVHEVLVLRKREPFRHASLPLVHADLVEEHLGVDAVAGEFLLELALVPVLDEDVVVGMLLVELPEPASEPAQGATGLAAGLLAVEGSPSRVSSGSVAETRVAK